MTMLLGGVTLPHMIWREQYINQNRVLSIRRTLGGRPVINIGNLYKGQTVTLSASEFNGVLVAPLKKSMVNSLLVLADAIDATYIFSCNGVEQSVIFAGENPIAMTPIIAKTVYTANDLLRGDIKLLTV